ncbi:hypothetical protein RYX45_00755 [Alkalihalophilus pseudofirmus]|uniref:DUF4190 domain-containing protein n=1 Tax=Alkalihalophilus pseudofirmus TaxID=79885 RepID=A0AAJ2KVB8_ALKPS|nr:hypothetical protein [Alkalihalophilus pseudofirmus]MDV2883690.1 hypothetical protein [Alkalihalophilus pseudofirmus]WEG17830.1 hypothetical protein PQ478_04880 [Alkalihalophilus pseudofirmus]
MNTFEGYNTRTITSLIFGMLAIIFHHILFVFILPLIVISIVFGIVGFVDIKKNGHYGVMLGIVGILCSLVGLWFLVLEFIEMINSVKELEKVQRVLEGS